MSFKKGSIGFRVAYSNTPIDNFIPLAKEQQIPPLETISDAVAYGWSASDSPLDKNFEDEHCGNGHFYELGFVRTQKKIQSSTYKAYLQERVNLYYNANVHYPKKNELASIKDEVVKLLLPMTAPSFKVTSVLFDSMSNRILASAMNDNDSDNVQRGISFASGASLSFLTPISLVPRLSDSSDILNKIDTVSASSNKEPFDEDNLGQYFLTWAFMKFCMASNGPFGVEVENDITGKEKCFITFSEPFSMIDKTEMSYKKGSPYEDASFWKAISEGKRIKNAKIDIVSNSLRGNVSFMFNADTFGFSSVKLPKISKELVVDDEFSTRAKIFNMIVDVMEGAYKEFLSIASNESARDKFTEECLAFISKKM